MAAYRARPRLRHARTRRVRWPIGRGRRHYVARLERRRGEDHRGRRGIRWAPRPGPRRSTSQRLGHRPGPPHRCDLRPTVVRSEPPIARVLKFSACYDSDPPDEVVRGLIEDEKKLFPPELRLVSPELLLPRVVRQQRVADPGNQRPGCDVGVTAHGLQGPGQEGFNLGGGRGIAFEEVTSLGHEGRAVRDGRGESKEVGAGIGRSVLCPVMPDYSMRRENIKQIMFHSTVLGKGQGFAAGELLSLIDSGAYGEEAGRKTGLISIVKIMLWTIPDP